MMSAKDNNSFMDFKPGQFLKHKDEKRLKEDVLSKDGEENDLTSLLPGSISIDAVSSAYKQRLRWGRKDDIELFQEIRILEKQGILAFEDILEMKNESEMEENSVLSGIKEKLGWRGSIKSLVIRIQTRFSDKFSTREAKILKNLVKRQGDILDYELILTNFPGKSIDIIKKA